MKTLRAMMMMMMTATILAAGCGGPDSELAMDEEALAGGTAWAPVAGWEAIGTMTGNLFCTATLITPYAAITAGHCATEGEAVTFTLPNGRGSIAGTARIHPRYNGIWWQAYDYAVIRFAGSIYDDPNVDSTDLTPMPILERELDLSEYVYLYGYGGFGLGANGEVDCSSGVDGQARYKRVRLSDINEDWNYDYISSTVSLCPGDSGGPLVVSDGGLKIAGINSSIDLSINHSAMKPAYMALDWIREHSSDPALPGNTWGNCVYYPDDFNGDYLSVQSGNHATMAARFNNNISTVWVKKNYQVTLYDAANYLSPVATLDGYNGNECNTYGCYHWLAAGADNRTTSAKCENVLPTNTWGYCVYYDRFGAGYYSTQGDTDSFSGIYAHFDNAISQIWVRAGHTATVYPRADYEPATYNQNTYWTSRQFTGSNGNWCNAFGCLHNLVGGIADNTASSIECN